MYARSPFTDGQGWFVEWATRTFAGMRVVNSDGGGYSPVDHYVEYSATRTSCWTFEQMFEVVIFRRGYARETPLLLGSVDGFEELLVDVGSFASEYQWAHPRCDRGWVFPLVLTRLGGFIVQGPESYCRTVAERNGRSFAQIVTAFRRVLVELLERHRRAPRFTDGEVNRLDTAIAACGALLHSGQDA